MCFMQKNNFHVKFPLSSECLNVRMVSFECLSADLVNFMNVSTRKALEKSCTYNIYKLIFVWLGLRITVEICDFFFQKFRFSNSNSRGA